MLNSKLKKEKVLNDLIKLREKSQYYLNKNKYNRALKLIELQCKLMYATNLEYTDDNCEDLIIEIGKSVNSIKLLPIDVKHNEKSILFYDYFCIDNRGLTQQYLNALMNLDYEITYVTYKDRYKLGENIIKDLNIYGKTNIIYLDDKDYLSAINELITTVYTSKANKVFIHTSPWDVIGVSAFSSLKDIITRYLINLTDHIFWLGKNSADYFIEFRSYGYQVSEKFRRISTEKLLILPYYPIVSSEAKFQGLPFDSSGKKIVFSGGALHKVYGDSYYFEIIEYILNKHDNVIFLYAGNGDDKLFRNFIIKNKFDNRLFLINERRDISEIFRRIHFYLDTYPISGGLMCQLAIANNKVPISYSNSSKISHIDGVLIEPFGITFSDKQEFIKEIDRLITDDNYLKSREAETFDKIISKIDFANELEGILKTNKTKFKCDYVNQTLEHDLSHFKSLEKQPSQYYSEFFSKDLFFLFGLLPLNTLLGLIYKILIRTERMLKNASRFNKH